MTGHSAFTQHKSLQSVIPLNVQPLILMTHAAPTAAALYPTVIQQPIPTPLPPSISGWTMQQPLYHQLTM